MRLHAVFLLVGYTTLVLASIYTRCGTLAPVDSASFDGLQSVVIRVAPGVELAVFRQRLPNSEPMPPLAVVAQLNSSMVSSLCSGSDSDVAACGLLTSAHRLDPFVVAESKSDVDDGSLYSTVTDSTTTHVAASSSSTSELQSIVIVGSSIDSDVLEETATLFGVTVSASGSSKYVSDLSQLSVTQRELFVTALASVEGVEWVEPVFDIKGQNYAGRAVTFGSESAVTSFLDNGFDGTDTIIGMSDSGVDTESCFFSDSTTDVPFDTFSSTHRKIAAYFTTADDDDTQGGHGTHVAATLLGDPTGDGRITELTGIQPKARLCLVDLGVEDSMSAPSDLGDDLFQLCYDGGAKIMTNSWGFLTTSYTSASREVDQFAWDNKDFLPIFSAGNYGEEGYQTILAPSNAKNCLSVGASLTSYDGYMDACCPYGSSASDCCSLRGTIISNPDLFSEATLAEFSSLGPTLDLRLKPDVIAVGGPLRSAKASSGDTTSCSYDPLIQSGTSMAAPLAAGAANVIHQYFTQGHDSENGPFTPSAALVKAVLALSATSLTSTFARTPVTRDAGIGRIELKSVLPVYDSGAPPLWVDDSSSFASQADAFYTTFVVSDNSVAEYGRFTVVLSWTDPPASYSAVITLVNDLDVTVQTPSGEFLYPNGLEIPDPLNNLLVIDVSDVEAGVYTVAVTARRLSQTPQPFALAVSGSSTTLSQDPDCGDGNTYLGGRCYCTDELQGAFCELDICPNDCNGQGECTSSGCSCVGNWVGVDCSFGFCGGRVELNSSKGVITDHTDTTGAGSYLPSQDCEWLLPSSVYHLSFTRLCTEATFDAITVTEADAQTHSFSGCTVPDDIIVGGPVDISFSSDGSVQKTGFELEFRLLSECSADCNGHGLCVGGECECDSGFSGSTCSNVSCSHNCHETGTCDGGECVCSSGYSGTQCQKLTCGSSQPLAYTVYPDQLTDSELTQGAFGGPFAHVWSEFIDSDSSSTGSDGSFSLQLAKTDVSTACALRRMFSSGLQPLFMNTTTNVTATTQMSLRFAFDPPVSAISFDYMLDTDDVSLIVSVYKGESLVTQLYPSSSSVCSDGGSKMVGQVSLEFDSSSGDELIINADGSDFIIGPITVQPLCSSVSDGDAASTLSLSLFLMMATLVLSLILV